MRRIVRIYARLNFIGSRLIFNKGNDSGNERDKGIVRHTFRTLEDGCVKDGSVKDGPRMWPAIG